MKEIWKDIPGFEGWYQASNIGRIRSVDRYVNYKTTGQAIRNGKILSPKTSTKGYLEVTLLVNGKYHFKRVHRLVALTFIPNPNNFPQINHINENKQDNRIENLEWCTPRQNSEAYTTQRNTVYQYDLQGKLIKVWHSLTRAAESIGGDKTGIEHCCKGRLSDGRSKKIYLGYIWSYKLLSAPELSNKAVNEKPVKVMQLDLEGNILHIWSSTAAAAKAVGCNQSAISMAINGMRKTIKGFQWKRS